MHTQWTAILLSIFRYLPYIYEGLKTSLVGRFAVTQSRTQRGIARCEGVGGAERVKSLEVSRESRDIASSTHAVGD